MKGKILGKLLLCLLFLSTCQIINAQEEPLPPLQFQITGGYTFPNIAGNEIAKQGSGKNSGAFNAAYLEIGYKPNSRIVGSLYISDAGGATGNFTWIDSAFGQHIYNYTDNIFTIGLSGAFYFTNGERFCPYVGAMLGYRIENFLENGDYPEVGSANVSYQSFSYQVYLGASYYFVKWCGIDARISYGNNYYVSVGLTFKIEASRTDD